tara:strand:+ start:1299 stop:2051 length:753 start_codon:yes stop_codon:yes gene_type:complete
MNSTVETFEKNIDSVKKLIHFDRDVLDIAITSIESLHNRLTEHPHYIQSDQANGKRTLDLLNGIRDHDSLKASYSIINNQAVVLLVSYFGSAIADLFRKASKIAVADRDEPKVLEAELKLKVEELLAFGSSFGDSIGDMLISKNSISFQDMKSIQREFGKYFGIKIEKDRNVNNIILGQACRHSIAHEAGIVNSRVINQISSAIPRDLKLNMTEGQLIEFSEQEIETVANSMLSYVVSLNKKVDSYRENI